YGLSCSFFFFQAEDGIRDGHVTGVQTCALPISGTGDEFYVLPGKEAFAEPERWRRRADPDGAWKTFMGIVRVHELMASIEKPIRSEERRVGKECRSRWWAYE